MTKVEAFPPVCAGGRAGLQISALAQLGRSLQGTRDCAVEPQGTLYTMGYRPPPARLLACVRSSAQLMGKYHHLCDWFIRAIKYPPLRKLALLHSLNL